MEFFNALLHHEYTAFINSAWEEVSRGYGRDTSNDSATNKLKAILGRVPGKVLKDGENQSYGKSICTKDDGNNCMNKCLEKRWNYAEAHPPVYGWLIGSDCQDIQNIIYESCEQACKK